MSTQLGNSGSIPVGLDPSISIPSSNAPQNQLRTDQKLQMLSTPSGAAVDTYKLLASSSDVTPGYLDSKIGTQFGVVAQKLNLIGFGALTTDNLTQGVTNQYLTTTNFNNLFALRSTTNLTEGANQYYTSARFNSAFGAKTTDDLTEGLTNLYLTSALLSDINSNTSARHSHANKSFLDTLSASSLISTSTPPIDFTNGTISHLDSDGYKHVPATSTTNNNKILTAGASDGVFSWTTFDTVAATSGIFEVAPSTSVVKTLTSNYIKTHVENSLTAKHVTAADLTYIGTTIPAHIASTLAHVPSFTPVTDRLKFLQVSNSDTLTWVASSTSLVKAGTGTYVNVSGGTVTVDPIDITDTNITAGLNISIVGNSIAATQRAITDIPSTGDSTTSISSGWADTHGTTYGNLGHVPTAGTAGHFLAWDGTFQDISAYVTNSQYTYKITLGAGTTIANRIATQLDAPAGWSVVADTVPTDLSITHGLTKDVVDVTVYADDGSLITKMIGSAAYGTIIGNALKTIVKVTSLATINQKIHLYIQLK